MEVIYSPIYWHEGHIFSDIGQEVIYSQIMGIEVICSDILVWVSHPRFCHMGRNMPEKFLLGLSLFTIIDSSLIGILIIGNLPLHQSSKSTKLFSQDNETR